MSEESAATEDSLEALTAVVTSVAATGRSAEEVAKAKDMLLSIKNKAMEKGTDPPSDVSFLVEHIAALEQLIATSAEKLTSGSANKENEPVANTTTQKVLANSSTVNKNAQPALVRLRSVLW